MAAERTTDVLDATLRCLLRYGVRRTTVDDIAAEVGISRSAVYQYVRSKDDAVRGVAGRLHEQAVRHARAAAVADTPLAERVYSILSAKVELATEPFAESPHATELFDEQARLCGDICRDFTAELHSLLASTLTAADIDRPDDAARILLSATIGLLSTGRPDLLRRATDALLEGISQ
ncbi:TetR/AcrR family transcriptional regulator [Nocardia uniformis]|uniref:TetR/AcrR family transcriptional regulator n=1 Tax=Nocardia uniformis TaxID=53432 RepID=A0A849C3P3_9NOCA|nr:TetR/AcrR family transcriptional regulator [Nocardia uniformis]NNH70397.1 TetR/AcrR family transcriptional regulator [Nocardia uniformis]